MGSQGNLPDLSLPLTWKVNLLALVGFALGSAAGMREIAAESPRICSVRTGRACLCFAAIGLAVVGSFLVAGRPLASFWRLSGTYGQLVDSRVHFGPLDLMPTTAVMFVLVLAAARRTYRRLPTVAELVMLFVTALVTLGAGTRYRFLLLALGWLFIQGAPVRVNHEVRSSRLSSAVLCGLAAAGAFLSLGLIGNARSAAASGLEQRSSLAGSIDSIDVIGSAELLLQRGAGLGSFQGRSYLDLPGQFVPSVLVRGAKEKPLTVQVTDEYLDPKAGFSAPYWFESALNFGLQGTLLVSFLFAAVLVRLQAKLQAADSDTKYLLQLCGPVTILILYQLLSRIATEQLLYTVGSLVLGAWLAGWSLTGPGRPGEGAREYDARSWRGQWFSYRSPSGHHQ
ncbi:hypothetical protein [Frankia tisae]|uniref:hypothetical protein n=1 Tax=Frankia tisae TaxID=2950104 RepID=UPI0021C141DC|nr:hypothetical protein [Frankia tisae]